LNPGTSSKIGAILSATKSKDYKDSTELADLIDHDRSGSGASVVFFGANPVAACRTSRFGRLLFGTTILSFPPLLAAHPASLHASGGTNVGPWRTGTLCASWERLKYP
jgi:hypothetical protein